MADDERGWALFLARMRQTLGGNVYAMDGKLLQGRPPKEGYVFSWGYIVETWTVSAVVWDVDLHCAQRDTETEHWRLAGRAFMLLEELPAVTARCTREFLVPGPELALAGWKVAPGNGRGLFSVVCHTDSERAGREWLAEMMEHSLLPLLIGVLGHEERHGPP